jgi:hypothetical protein
MPRPRLKVTVEDRRTVEKLSAIRVSEDNIANAIGIDPKTLRKWFSKELKMGAAKGEVNLRQKSFQMAMDGDSAIMRRHMDALDSKQTRGHQQNGSFDPPVDYQDVRARLSALLDKRAAAWKHQQAESEVDSVGDQPPVT